MAQNKKISQLTSLVQADSNDIFPIVDLSESETKKITVGDLFASPQPIGSSNPSSGRFTTLQVSAGSVINEFSTDQNLGGDSDSAVPTEKAVKTYVDTQISLIDVEGLNIRRVNTDTTAVVSDVVLVDTTNGNITIELIGGNDGRIIIKKISPDSNVITVISNVGTIDAQASKTITAYNQSHTFVGDGTEFFIV